MDDKLKNATLRLLNYIEQENYSGFDPYDGLKSPFFKLPFLKTNKLIRLYAQQAVKRSRLNLRPFLFIKKGYNPVTLGLCVQAYSYLLKVFPEREIEFKKKIDLLIGQLQKLQSKKFSGASWGYDFDWEARYAKIPGYEPTVVATGIITNALFECYCITGNETALSLCKSAVQFVLKDLKRTIDADGDFCFSYSPFDTQVVFNASMKGARLLSQVYSVTKENQLKTEAKKAVAFVMKHQQPSGSWIYSTSEVGGWVDNYHTGYVIDCLHEYILRCSDNSFDGNLLSGLDFYFNNFFEEGKVPKFYDKKIYPIDCTSAGQSLLTLSRFDKLKLAGSVSQWMSENMQDKRGFFYFRKYKTHTEKIPFMRWSNAWMFTGMSYLLYKMSRK